MKIKSFLLFGSTLLLIISLLALPGKITAQDYGSPLESIKSRLESENIHVVDYSQSVNIWGNLPTDWITFLKDSNFESLRDVADRFEDLYNDLQELRNEQAIMEAEKSTMTNRQRINEASIEILEKEIDIINKEYEIKGGILEVVEPGIEAEGNKQTLLNNLKGTEVDIINEQIDVVGTEIEPQTTVLERDLSALEQQLSQDAGIISLLFQELDFMINVNKWGRLPIRITAVLEENGYESLNSIVEEYNLRPENPNVEDAYETLQRDLADIDTLDNDDIELITESTIIVSAEGERQLNQVIRSVVNAIKNLIGILAVAVIIIAGIRMIFADGDENVVTTQKRALLYGVVGLVAVLLMDRMIDILLGPAGVQRTELVRDEDFNREIYGIISFIEVIIGTVAIAFIILSGVRTILAQGEEEQITKQRQTLLWIGVGLITLAVDQVIIENIFIQPVEQSDQITTSNIQNIINIIANVLQFILGFVGLIALGILVYGAGMMIANYGNDEMVEKSKKIIRNAIIGIIVIISAYTIVATLVVFN
jgi:hypothetical protein